MWTIDNWYRQARAEAEASAEFLRGLADHWINTLTTSLPDMPRAKIMAELKKFNRRRLDAVPSTATYPELRGMRELIDAEWRGTQDGAKMNDDQAAASQGAFAFYSRYVSSGRIHKLAANCSYVFFPTSEVGPILANNLDSSPNEPFTQPGWIAASEHLIFGGVSSGVFYDEESPEIFPAPVFKLAARYCRNSAEAVELLTRYKLFWGPGNLIVIDREKRAAMIEKTACRIGVRWSSDGFAYITAMSQRHPEIKAYVHAKRAESLTKRGLPTPCADTVYWAGNDKRNDLMATLLDDARKNPTVEALRKIIQFRDPVRGNVAGNGEVLFPEGPPSEFTLKTQIWQLAKGRAMWWARDAKTGKPSYENRMPDVEFKNVWLWD